jgi:hypothetical protein
MKASKLAELMNGKENIVLNGEFLFIPNRFAVLFKNETFLKLGVIFLFFI